MIKANELRIGNYVMDDFTRIGRVLSFNEKTITIKLPFSVLKLNSHKDVDGLDVYPIPLTTELLEACGFECTPKGFYVHANWYNLSLKFYINTYDLKSSLMERIATNINYLHELQNLFFALTGEELTIDANKLN